MRYFLQDTCYISHIPDETLEKALKSVFFRVRRRRMYDWSNQPSVFTFRLPPGVTIHDAEQMLTLQLDLFPPIVSIWPCNARGVPE
jgi:hypothetical protein